MIDASASGMEARQDVGSTEEAFTTLGSDSEVFATFASIRALVPFRAMLLRRVFVVDLSRVGWIHITHEQLLRLQQL